MVPSSSYVLSSSDFVSLFLQNEPSETAESAVGERLCIQRSTVTTLDTTLQRSHTASSTCDFTPTTLRLIRERRERQPSHHIAAHSAPSPCVWVHVCAQGVHVCVVEHFQDWMRQRTTRWKRMLPWVTKIGSKGLRGIGQANMQLAHPPPNHSST
jgi:hypothetical protein